MPNYGKLHINAKLGKTSYF